MIESTLTQIDPSVEETQKKYYGVVVGKVIDLGDPMQLGRVKVQLPFIDSVDLSPWARVAVPMAGLLHGSYFIPNIGDEVLVAFEHGDVKAPYILGSLWNAMAPPPLPSPLAQTRTIRTPIGNQVTMKDTPPEIAISTVAPAAVSPGVQNIRLDSTGIQLFTTTGSTINLTGTVGAPPAVQIVVGSSTISVTPQGITITGGNLSLTATGTLSLSAGGTCSIKAPMVTIN